MSSTDIENLLIEKLGEDFEMTTDEAFHPKGFRFYADSNPAPAFSGFTETPLCEANLLLGEMDDDKKHRVERLGYFLIYTVTDYYKSEVNGVYGQILECAVGSSEEAAFMEKVAAAMVRDAAEPLQSVVKALDRVGLGSLARRTSAEALRA